MPDGIDLRSTGTTTPIKGLSPGWIDGYVPKAAEWNSWWALKLDTSSALVRGGPYLSLSGGTMTGRIFLSFDPIDNFEAATKNYSDVQDLLRVSKAGDIMTGPLILYGAPTQPLGAATKAYTDAADALRVNRTGDTMTGLLVLSGDPSQPLGAVTRQYADAADALRLPLSGGIMSGPLILNADPTAPTGAATKSYTDAQVAAFSLNYVPLSQKGVASGVASLDATGLVPISQLPASLSGNPVYLGVWNPSTNTPTLATGGLLNGVATTKGQYFVCSVSGTTSPIDTITTWVAGDWAISTGAVWQRIQMSTGSYLPIAGGTLTSPGTIGGIGGLTFTESSIIRAGASSMPDLAWWYVDPAGHIPMAMDVSGTLLTQNVAILGSATINNPSFTGTAPVFPALTITNALTLNTLQFAGSDYEQVTASAMPDLARWVRDPAGNIIFAFDTKGTTVVNNLQVIGTLIAPGFAGGGGGDDPNSFSPSLIDARDAKATANSMAVKGQTNSQIQQPVFTHNMVLIYGQSLSVGNQGLPRMSTNEGLDNLTLGLAPGGTQTATDYVFIPDTNSLINPLDSTRGYETPGISATNQWRQLQLAWRDLTADPTRRLIVNGCGEGGKAIEELSKGFATPCYFDRIASLLNQVKTAIMAASSSNTFGVVAVYYLQGEANYSPSFDMTTAGYQAKWEQLRLDITTTIKGITGQKLAPAYFASQPNSEWDNTLQQNSIAMAYINACTTPPLGDFLCMPNYAAPNSNPNGPHMSPDGYRYMGNGVGKIMHRVFERGEGWLPLYPVKITYRGKELLLECHTPEPPLQVQPFYGGSDGSTVQPILTDYGFSCGDSLGSLHIVSIDLYNSVIRITCDRTVATGAWVDYANKGHNGCGNICDSDPFISLDAFGTLPTAMLGLPYPSWNWMVAFRINATSDV